MSEIDGPSTIPFKTGEGAARVTRASTTSDDSSTQQQSAEQKAKNPEKQGEVKEKTVPYETAVTLSSTLSNLENGVRFSAHYDGIDGQNRPIVTAESGRYVIKYEVNHQQNIDKLPPNATVNIKILKIDREIEARLTFIDPTQKPPLSSVITIPVKLELTGLGNQPPRIHPTTTPQSAQQSNLHYQTSILQQAEKIAIESAQKLQQLPLPTNSTNYTLFERSIPQHDRPVIIETKIAGNALIAQEQVANQATPKMPDIPTVASQAASPTSSATPPIPGSEVSQKQPTEIHPVQIEKLLHKNIQVTVVKNFPREVVALPEIVQKQLGLTFPLDNVKAGNSVTLRIESIAVPDHRPDTIDQKVVKPPAPSLSGTASEVTPPATTFEPKSGFSGIVIDPQQNIVRDAEAKALLSSEANRPYSKQAAHSNYAPRKLEGKYKTLYVATPTSVVRLQSPIPLLPGTVINFFQPEIKTETRPESQTIFPAKTEAASPALPSAKGPEIQNPERTITPQNQGQPQSPSRPDGWTEISISEATGATSAPAFVPQPLTEMMQDWQSLSQILSVTASFTPLAIGPALNNRLPTTQNPGQMTSGMILFLAAIGAKSPARAWLGPEITQQLENTGHDKLLRSLDQDMQRIFRIRAEIPVNEWRPALIPLQVGGDVMAVPLLTRQVMDENQQKNKKSGEEDTQEVTATRFIVELDLSRIGQIQVDGLLKEKKLNIMIRSKIILPDRLKNDIRAMYNTALDISGYEGDLQFRENKIPDISVHNYIDQKLHIIQRNRAS